MQYHVNRDNVDKGRFTLEALLAAYQRGELLQNDLVWREGLEEWVPLGSLSELHGSMPSGDVVPQNGTEVPPAGEERNGPAWEDPTTGNAFARVMATLGPALSRPGEFFGRMRRTGGLGSPLLFYVALGWIAIVLNSILELPFQVLSEKFQSFSDFAIPGAAPAIGILIVIVLAPLLLVVGAFINAGVTHLCLMMLGGAKQPFETTFRVVCYSYGAVVLFQAVPFCGGFIAGIWGLVMEIIGLSKAHSIGGGKATAAVLLPAVICCGGAMIIMVAIFGAAAIASM